MNLVLPSMALVKRELLTSLRRKRSYFMLLAVVSFVFCIFFAGLFDTRRYGLNMANQAQGAFFTLTGFLYFVGVLLAPAMAGASICVEKQQHSFDLLSTTLIRPAGIIFAKMLNSLTFFYLIVIALMPLLGVLFFFVGIDPKQFFHTFLQIALTVTGCTAAGLLCSAWFHRTIPAQVASFALAAVYIFNLFIIIPFYVYLIMSRGNMSGINPLLEKFALSTPVVCLVQAWEGQISPAVFQLNLLYHGFFLTLFWGLTLLILRRPPRPLKVDTRKPIDDVKVLRERRKRFPFYLIDPQRRRKAIPDGRNPMYVKEMYSGMLGRGTQRARMFYVALICSFFPSLLLATAMISDVRELLEVMLVTQTGFFLVVAPLSVANSLPKEYELGNMDGLQSTLLRPRDIIFGKLFGGAMALAPLILGATTGALICYAAAFREDPDGAFFGIVTGYAIMFVSLFWLLSTALCVTTYCRKSLTAIVAVYVTEIILLVILPVRLGMEEETLLMLSPITMAIWYLDSPQAITVSGLYVGLLVYFLLSVVVLCGTVQRFARSRH
jgi:hypothetical protein